MVSVQIRFKNQAVVNVENLTTVKVFHSINNVQNLDEPYFQEVPMIDRPYVFTSPKESVSVHGNEIQYLVFNN